MTFFLIVVGAYVLISLVFLIKKIGDYEIWGDKSSAREALLFIIWPKFCAGRLYRWLKQFFKDAFEE